METFETQALETVNLRLKLRLWYVDGIYAVQEHGDQLLNTSRDYLSKQHPALLFTVEVGVDGRISVWVH